MPEWLRDSFATHPNLHLGELALRMILAFVFGCIVATIYRVTYGRRSTPAPGMMATLVLLSVLIGMVTLVIGDSVARAFSLVGSLAIVRFRTVVEDTRDTAFVIFAVGVGMAAGTGHFLVPLIAIPFVTVASFLFRPRDPAETSGPESVLILRIGVGRDPESLLREAFAKHLERSRLTGTTTARQGAALELTYAVRLRHANSVLSLVTELNGLDGVQGVELRQ